MCSKTHGFIVSLELRLEHKKFILKPLTPGEHKAAAGILCVGLVELC